MSRDGDESRLFSVAKAALDKFISSARDKVMAPFRGWGGMPDPAGVFQAADDWNTDTILTTIGQIAMSAWSEATDVPPVSRHAFVMAQLAETQNFLARIPDEVYNLVFAEITDGVNGGESIPVLADRVDRVLATTGSERWPNRARVIARTETTRAYGAGTVAAGLEQSRVTGRLLQKRWRHRLDDRVRNDHAHVSPDPIPLYQPFDVGGWPMLFPGDPTGPADEVVNCRCDLVIVNEGGR